MKDDADLYLRASDKPYVFRDLNGFSPGVSRLVFMLDYARRSTLDAVRGLGAAQLDTKVLTQGNTVGLLLEHIAQVEQTYQSVTFRGVWPSGEGAESVFSERRRESIRGYALEHYLSRLRSVRAETFSELGRRDDSWLHREYAPWPHGTPANNFFCWFHVLEDELRHGGQIAVLRKELEQPT